MTSIKVVFFDYGGVIAGEPLVVEERFGKKFPKDPVFEQVAYILNTPFDKLWVEVGGDTEKMLSGVKQGSDVELLLKGKISEEEIWKRYTNKEGLSLPKNASELLAIRNEEIYLENQEILTLLSILKTNVKKVGLISNTAESQALFNEQRGRYDYFDPVVLSCRIGYKKPEKEIYQVACKLSGYSPSECLFIDDTPKNLDGAAKLGMSTLHYRNGIETVQFLKEQLQSFNIDI
jgi:putative hydrolase of the HAD superfamily